jgi:hypothetical protein
MKERGINIEGEEIEMKEGVYIMKERSVHFLKVTRKSFLVLS